MERPADWTAEDERIVRELDEIDPHAWGPEQHDRVMAAIRAEIEEQA